MLQVTDVKKVFSTADNKVAAVDGISLRIEQGQFASIVGQSGSGKTTLLSLLGALEKPTSGSIEVDGQDITKLGDHSLIRYRARKIGFVFQSYNLVPNLTAIENVMLPMLFTHVPKLQRQARAQELLTRVGLMSDKQSRKPGRLSGGEQQRVAIARALANQPTLILADEPTGNLDSKNGEIVFRLLRDLSRSEKTTVVIVTHDQSIADKADKVFRLSDGKLKEN
jgi:putative ABC transport system ATP-binding protein